MLWRLFLHSPPSSLVSFLFLLLFPLTLRSALPPPSTVSSDGSLPKQRVILAFPFGTGCAHTSSGSGGDYPMLLAKEVRESVMRQLDAKVADFLQRLAVGGVLTGQGHNSQDVSLKTRYLSGLQMEVTEVPQGMHAADMVELARTIDCVQDVYEDSNKYAIPDDDSIVLDQDSNLIQQPRGNNPENSLPLDEISAPPVRNLQLHQRLDPLAFVRSVEEGFTPCQADPSLCLGSEITSTSLVEHENRAGTEGVVSLKAEQSVKVETASPSDGGLMAGQIGGEHGGGVSGSWKPPTDTLFASQWSLQGSEPMSTQVEKVWPWWTGASNPLIVAVIDSGCDLSHPDLKNRLWKNPGEICGDGIDNDGNGFVDDCHGYNFAEDNANPHPGRSGHGTGAAGIVAAESNNNSGIAGICWGCQIMCLKFIGNGQGRVSDQVQAIDYAVRMGAKISNNSYGGYGRSSLEYSAIERAQVASHLFVCSAGNNNVDTDLPINDHTPSVYNLHNIVAVGAIDNRGDKASFSNYGRNSVDVVAPGVGIRTVQRGGTYAAVSGTSFAAPAAAGVAALVWSAFPSLSFIQVKQSLVDSCITPSEDAAVRDLSACQGRMNAQRALYVAGKWFCRVCDSVSSGGLSLRYSLSRLRVLQL
eukprot:GHVS01103145.1.p1 GENE.GHVS01103145.1~~GHVS01103145.1.p1  ORF type:complete len:642 (-),score=66.58 GHVS01103145.1:440-2365(-)